MARSLPRVLVLTRIGGFLRPSNGGQLRTHHLLRRLCEHAQVDLFNPGMAQIVTQTEEWAQLSLGSLITPRWMTLLSQMRLKRGWSRTIRTLERVLFKQSASIDHVDFSIWFINRMMTTNSVYDVVILDTLSIPPITSWQSPGRKVWLNAHNVESQLNPMDTRVLQLEKTLSQLIDGVIACTPDDATRFEHLNSHPLQTLVWPNGTASQPSPKGIPKHPKAIFIGSLGYPPNKDGLNWYFKQIHPLVLNKVPQFELTIVGRAPRIEDLEIWEEQPNTTIHTNVASITPYLEDAAFSIVPLLHGSGSRLKIADSLMHGRPVLSTSIGAEGYNQDTYGLTLANEPEDFAQKIIQHIMDSAEFQPQELHHWAMRNLSWDVTIQPEQILNSK